MKQPIEQRISADLAELDVNPAALASLLGELIEIHALYAKIWACLPLDIAIADGDGRLLAATPKLWRETLGYLEEAPAGYLTAALSRLSADVAGLAEVDNALADGQSWFGTLRLKGRRGRLFISIAPLDEQMDGEGIFLVRLAAEDNASRAADGDLQKEFWRDYEADLPFTQMGKLAAGVAHELKNSLQLFSGSVQIMQASYPDDPAVQAHLRLIHDEVLRSNELLYGFMGLGRHEYNVASYHLNDLIREILPVLQGECRLKRIELGASLAPELPKLALDRTRIKQVLINCVMNSEQAILRRREQESGLCGEINISTAWDEAAQEARLTVSDNGVGLTPEQAERFFEPFYSTANGGHGLGTAISRAIVELHGGRMEVAGAPGAGCRVTLRLPRQTKLAADPADVYDAVARRL